MHINGGDEMLGMEGVRCEWSHYTEESQKHYDRIHFDLPPSNRDQNTLHLFS